MNSQQQNSGQADTIAYFSMEIALEPGMPTYSGGLGVLAGDTIRSAADLKVPMVAVTLLHRKGYFHQKLDSNGWQTESPAEWPVEKFCRELPGRAYALIEGRTVQLRAWRYLVKGISGHEIPVILLDADLPDNTEWDRRLTDLLYGGDARYRLCQEAVLGVHLATWAAPSFGGAVRPAHSGMARGQLQFTQCPSHSH